jgi:hypothetical protein
LLQQVTVGLRPLTPQSLFVARPEISNVDGEPKPLSFGSRFLGSGYFDRILFDSGMAIFYWIREIEAVLVGGQPRHCGYLPQADLASVLMAHVLDVVKSEVELRSERGHSCFTSWKAERPAAGAL